MANSLKPEANDNKSEKKLPDFISKYQDASLALPM
jgi:hypothetical protein